MNIALNGWFWNRPDTGSGQYLRGLVRGLLAIAPELALTLIVPQGWSVDAPEGVALHPVPLKWSGHIAKLRFEQDTFPSAAAKVGASIAHASRPERLVADRQRRIRLGREDRSRGPGARHQEAMHAARH